MTLDLERWQALSPLLDRALELDGGERTAWLGKLWESDPALAAEVQALLDERASVDREGFLEHSPLSAFAPQPSLAGQLLGAYRLETQIGHGGMGSVWLARRSDGRFDGKVAIKLLNAALVGRVGEERFRREGRILARLTHPNIARLIDAGVAPGGQPYLVLEFVEGEPIDRYCKTARLGIDERLRLFVDVLEAVAHAHANLVIHRDIKPSNVLVTEQGRVKLLDFGIAKLVDDETALGDATQLTREAGRVLTPDFAAPEQVLGEPVTTATDVYSVGVLLYLLLSGRHPFGDRTHSPADLINSIVETAPPRIRKIPRDLDNIVAKALKKDPRERYPSVTAFADDIQRYLRHEPVAARPDTSGYRAAKFVRRNRVAVALSALAVVALIGGLARTVTQAERATREAAVAERERDQARYQAQRAEASSEMLNLMFEEFGTGGKPLTSDALVDRGVELVERRYQSDPHLRALMLVQLARRYGDLNHSEKERTTKLRALALAEQNGDDDVAASAQCSLVKVELDAGKPDDAKRRYEEGTAALARVSAPSIMSQADCLRAAAHLRRSEGLWLDAVRPLQEAKALLERAGDTRTLSYTSVLNDLGMVYFGAGRWREGLENNQALLDLFERNARGTTIGYANLLFNRASILYNVGEIAASEEKARAARERARAFSDLDASAFALAEGRAAARLGKSAAIDVLRNAATETEARNAPFWTARARFDLAQALSHERRFEEASAELAAAEAFWSRDPNGNAGNFLLANLIRAEMALGSDDKDNAQRLIDDAESMLDKPSANTPFYRFRWNRMASVVALARGDAARADALASEALRIAESVARDPAQSADVGEALLLHAKARIAQGDSSTVRPLLERAATSLDGGLGSDHALTKEAHTLLASLRE